MRFIPLSLLLLAACSGDKDDDGTDTVPLDADTDTDTDTDTDADTDTDTDTDTDVDCTATITSVEPEPGYQLAPIDQTVTITFDAAIAATDSWSLDISGVAGSSALDTDGLGASFVPDSPLANDMSFTVNAAVCTDTATATFRTLPPAVDSTMLTAKAYGVPFDTLVITKPGNATLLEQFLPIDYLAVQVGTVDPVTNLITALGGVAVEDQYGEPVLDCGAAIEGVELDFSLNPFFRMGPTILYIDAGDTEIAVREFQLLGKFSPDTTEIQNVHVEGLIDLSEQTGALACGTVAALTAGTCVPCTIGAVTNDCLEFEGDAPVGNEDVRLDIQGICFPATP